MALALAAPCAPMEARASDLSVMADALGEQVYEEPIAAPLDDRAASNVGKWITFKSDSTSKSRQVSDYFINATPNADGSVGVTVRTTLYNDGYNYMMWSTTKTIFADGKQVAYIGPDYREVNRGQSMSQQASFNISGGGSHHVTSKEEDFRDNTLMSAGWDFWVSVPYVVKATAATGGSITSSGAVYVDGGASKTYTVTPAAGYRIGDVQVDGKSVGAVGSYTFSNVNANHTISATFVKTYKVTFTDGVTGNVLKTQTVDTGKGASAPAVPAHDGYRFDKWDRAFSSVASDITVKAVYVKTYQVTFADSLTGATLKTQTVDTGKAASAPPPPRARRLDLRGVGPRVR